MALFKTTADLKAVLPKAVGDIVGDVMPFIELATEKYLERYLGAEMVEELDEAYNSETPMSDELAELLYYAQKPVAWFAMLMYADQGGVLITKSGFRIASTEEMKTAFKWQVDELKTSYREMGYYGIESMIKFLDKHLSDYASYLDSTAFNSNREHFINYASDFEQYYFIDGSRNVYEVLRAQMREIENTVVKDTLGEAYYAEFKAKIVSDDLNTNDGLIYADLKSAIARLTIAQGILSSAIKITNLGVMVNSYEMAGYDVNTNQKPATELQKSTGYYQAYSSGQMFLKRVATHLNTNASADDYPLYFESEAYVDPAAEDASFDNSDEGARIFVT